MKNTKKIDVGWADGNTIIEENIFINAETIVLAPNEGYSKAIIRNNLFVGGSINIKLHNFSMGETIVENNSFSPNKYAIYVTNGDPKAKLIARNNYWGTTNVDSIDAMIYDKNDDLKSGIYVDGTNPLKDHHANTPTLN